MKRIVRDWRELKLIQSTKLVQSTYVWLVVVPIAVKLLNQFGDTATIKIGGIPHTIDLVLPFSWQMFYLSALSFVIGNIVFIAFAPKISKEFLDYGDFKAKGKLAKDIGMYASREHANRTEQINNIMKSCRDYGLLKFEPSQNPNDAYHASENEKQKFWDLFNERVTSRLWGRIICTLCYFSGMVFFVIVALQNVYWTINEIFSFA
ncbi:TPA: MFS transporter permease [Vibrio parahaemolyticus]|nr:MFS transporter permease [Vibrio parahaemolyticus]